MKQVYRVQGGASEELHVGPGRVVMTRLGEAFAVTEEEWARLSGDARFSLTPPFTVSPSSISPGTAAPPGPPKKKPPGGEP